MGRKPRSRREKAEEKRHLERLGRRLRSLREAKSLTPQDLADKLGVTPQYIYMIEAGKAKPSESRLNELADALGDLADEFLSTALEQVELEFEAKLREAGLSPDEIQRAATRVSQRAKEDVVAGKEPLRVMRRQTWSPDAPPGPEADEETVALCADMSDPGIPDSASDYAAAAREEFGMNKPGRRRPASPRPRGERFNAGPDAEIVVDRPVDDRERNMLRHFAALIDEMLDKNSRRR